MTDSIKQKQRLERKIKNRKEEIAKIIKSFERLKFRLLNLSKVV